MEYNQEIASHYKAYRPSLHKIILEKCLGNRKFDMALDIGSGTGVSTVALLPYCSKITGIEPSESMLKQAKPNPSIRYLSGDGEHLPFTKSTFNLIALAGVLYYAKSQRLVDEIERVLKANGLVFIYDFDILTKPFLEKLTKKSITNRSTYKHDEDFSGLHLTDLKLLTKKKETHQLIAKPRELAHLLLSDQDNYEALFAVFGKEELLDRITESLHDLYSDNIVLNAHLYYCLYSN